MSTITADTPALEAKSTDIAERLAGLQIENLREVAPSVLTHSLEGAALIARLADDFVREVEASWGPVCKAADEAHKKAVAERDRLKKPAQKLKEDAGKLGWMCNAELKRREEEQVRIVEAERQRLQKIADDDAAAERARLQKIADDARLAEALTIAESGDVESADRLIAEPVLVPAVQATPVFMPPAPRLAPKIEGQSFGETWGDYEVTDLRAVPDAYKMVDDKKIRGVIRAMKGSTNIPGIRVSDPRPKATVRQARA